MLRKLYSRLRAEESRQPMWKNFLKAIGLLVAALAVALYSSSAALEGDVTSTIVAAFASLGIAAWVGIRFVPRLADGVDWTWMPVLTQFRLTRDGGIFLGGLLVVLSAAVNTSNNLLYMVLSALLAVMLLSGLLAARNFKYLQMEPLLPARAFAGETIPLSVRIRNHRRIFPSFSLQIEPPGKPLYFSVIRPRGTVQHLSETTFSRRGRYTFERLRVTSRFPFGFFVKTRQYLIDAECICYPEILPQDRLEFSVTDILGTHERMERGLGSDLHTIRDYIPSDSARHVHWKATAKTATLKTREFAAEDSHRILLAFDRYGNPSDAERFESLVSRAASLAFHLIGNGAAVTFISDDWESPAETGEATLDAILDYLALVEMSPAAPLPDFDRDRGAVSLSLRHARD